MNKIYIFLFTLLSSVYTLQSQNDTTQNSNETLSLQTNSSVYLTGEDLNYTVTIKSENNPLVSKTIYITLVGKDSEKIEQEKTIQNNQVSGKIIINNDMKTGVYKIIAFTKKTLLQDEGKFAEKEISVVNTNSNTSNNDYSKTQPQVIQNNENVVSTSNLSPSGNSFRTSNETFSIHTNNSVYVTGESIYYSVFVKNTQDSLTSKIIYVTLVGKDHSSIQQEKIVANNNASGDIFLKTNLKSGIYKLIVYTKKSLLQEQNNYCELELPIINPYQTNTSYFSEEIVANNNLLISQSLLTGKQDFSKREKVTLNLPDLQKNSSISVRKVESFCVNRTSNSENKRTTGSKNINSYNSIPEVRGKILSGKIVDYKNVTSHDNYISLSTLNNDIQTKVSKITANGRFLFLFDEPLYEEKIVLQSLSEDKNLAFSIDSLPFDFNQLKWNTNLKISKTKRNEIDNRAVANQIDIAYYNSKKDTITQSNTSSYFYYPNYERINLNDYTRFNTIEEIIVELIPAVRIKEKEGKNNLFILNKETNPNLISPALTMINGIIVQDIDQLLKIKAKKFDEVHYIRDKYNLGSKLYDGVINFTSKENLLEANFSPYQIIEINPVLKAKKYYVEDYSKDKKERIPDQRYQLYWNPQIKDTKNISFYTSDVTGKFGIEIVTTNSDGSTKKMYQYFTVKE